MPYDPTPEQLNVIAHHMPSAYVHACPGAGKTRTIVARLKAIDRAGQPRKGIAFISFTNFAISEFQEKCLEEGILHDLRYPNFIGTFDSFIWKFVARPSIHASPGVTPQLINEWDLNVRLQHVAGAGIPLSYFNPQTRAFILPGDARPAMAQTLNDHGNDYVTAAIRMISALNRKGFYSTSDVRSLISRKLENIDFREQLGIALRGRFSEVIVDEAQDCNDIDIDILSWLNASRIPLKVVCDPGQAIYEFRNANPAQLQHFVRGLHQLPLTGNFRSSPVICALAATMRLNAQRDHALGEMQEVNEPVRLMAYTGRVVSSSVGERFFVEAANLNISRGNLVSVAHDRKSAMRAVGVKPPADNSKNAKRFLLAEATSLLKNSGSDTKAREKGINALAHLILSAQNLRDERRSLHECLKSSGISEREIYRQAVEIVTPLAPVCSLDQVDEWIDRAKISFTNCVNVQGRTVDQFFPRSDGWYLPLTSSVRQEKIFPFETIHQAKGRQYEGVLVSIKRGTDTIESWNLRTNNESLRVLYVGVTRAKRLIGIGVHEDELNVVRVILDRENVAYRLIN